MWAAERGGCSMMEPLLPPGVVTVEAYADVPGKEPFPGEEDLVARAVESRRAEFVTARRCAREALASLGYPAAAIRTGSGREPLWPAGVTGSITHCAGYRAAAVARSAAVASLGIDAEPHKPVPAGVAETVTIAGERTMLHALGRDHPGIHWDRVLFSAKESVYKAWYPLMRRWLGFEEAEVSFDPVAATFHARLLVPGAPVWTGRYAVERGLILTAVSVRPAGSSGNRPSS
jgi:4'-phosphopantetheinyl transferase EntD